MKKIELLAPAGNMESLIAAISAGCDAVYISGKKYGARAFANNFSFEELIESIRIAHLYDVKVYVTVNTLIYDSEMDDFLKYIEFLYRNNVDAIIMQDLGAMDLVRQIYPKLEIHASTQMNIHSLETVKLLEKLNIKRCVLAREMNISEIKNIKDNSNMELEVFVQGALCISYSGQCLMSSLIGGRSGNRGTCTQCCRMKYDLVKDNKIVNKDKYVLSTKDLCTLKNIDKLIDIGVDSIKIEGRMKRKEYVYLAVYLYRRAIDSYLNTGKVNITDNDILELKKIFSRNFTKGFLFYENNNNFTNPTRPNHQGVKIGDVISVKNNYFLLKLTDEVNLQDGIRVVDDDIGFIVTEMFVNDKKVSHAKIGDIVKIKKKIKSLSEVVKTTDYKQLEKINELIDKKRRLPLDIKLSARLNERLSITLNYKNKFITYVSDYIVSEAKNSPTTDNDIKNKINRLNDSVYCLNKLDINKDDNIFIPVGVLNNLRRNAIDKLNLERLKRDNIVIDEYHINLRDYPTVNKKSILIDSDIIPNNYDEVYNLKNMDNTTFKLNRIITNHQEIKKRVLVSELGSINKYKNVVTDFSLNVVNSYTVALLHSLGVDKITLSYELSYEQIKDIIDTYHKKYHKHPNLEVIISGYEEAMVCKYMLDGDYLMDRFKNKFRIKIRDNYMYIYNYKKRNLQDDFYKIGVNWIRINKELDNEIINI